MGGYFGRYSFSQLAEVPCVARGLKKKNFKLKKELVFWPAIGNIFANILFKYID